MPSCPSERSVQGREHQRGIHEPAGQGRAGGKTGAFPDAAGRLRAVPDQAGSFTRL